MRINSKNMFPRVISKEKRLNSIEKRILRKEQKLIEKFQSPVQTTKFFDIGFQKGFQEGEDEGYKRGYERGYSDQNEDLEAENAKLRQDIADKENKIKRSDKPDKPEKREYGGPVTKGKPYLVGEAGVEGFMPKFPIPDLPGLGGGGGGTNAITDKAKTKKFGTYMKDAFKIATFPFSRRNVKADPTEKFASEYVESDSSNNEFGNITSSMTNKPRVQTVVQPVIQTKTQQVPTPVPTSTTTQVIKTTKSKLPPSIAKMIN